MGKNVNWFEIDLKGFRELQLGKPKHHVVRELIQNAFDEQIKTCDIQTAYSDGHVTLSVTDDSPIGFRDLADAFTLYKTTYKRKDPEKRGRFNIGEKQAFAICDIAKIVTTKGTVWFDKTGRHTSAKASKSGTTVTVQFKATQRQYEEMVDMLSYYIVPANISCKLNGAIVAHRKPIVSLSAKLLTEYDVDGTYRRTTRTASVDVYEASEFQPPFLYEMGIPVQKIDCFFSIDIQQKIPLSVDRDSVSIAFLQDVFAEVLNTTYKLIPPELISQSWVRLGASDERASKEAVASVIKKRFGDKVVIANPFDPIANDDAISNGYKVVGGREMSKEEWDRVKENGLMQSSTALFGRPSSGGDFPSVEPNEQQKKFADFAKRIAKRVMNIEVSVEFVKAGISSITRATYGDRMMTVNTSRCNGLFKDEVSSEMISLIVHELGHEMGHHTQEEYHKALSRMAGALAIIAIEEPEFFNLKVG